MSTVALYPTMWVLVFAKTWVAGSLLLVLREVLLPIWPDTGYKECSCIECSLICPLWDLRVSGNVASRAMNTSPQCVNV